MRIQVQSLASLSGLRIQHCCELWSWTWLRSGIAVAVLVAAVPIQPLAWELPYAAGADLERKQKFKKKVKTRRSHRGSVVNESD